MKCKDYYIVKIPQYRFDDEINITFYKKVNKINKLKWDFIVEYSGFNQDYWYFEYIMDSLECGLEEIYEKHGVFTINGEGYLKFWIPKNKKDIYLWFIEYGKNNNLIIKTIKKTNIPIHTPINQYRKRSREFTLKSSVYLQLQKNNNEKK